MSAQVQSQSTVQMAWLKWHNYCTARGRTPKWSNVYRILTIIGLVFFGAALVTAIVVWGLWAAWQGQHNFQNVYCRVAGWDDQEDYAGNIQRNTIFRIVGTTHNFTVFTGTQRYDWDAVIPCYLGTDGYAVLTLRFNTQLMFLSTYIAAGIIGGFVAICILGPCYWTIECCPDREEYLRVNDLENDAFDILDQHDAEQPVPVPPNRSTVVVLVPKSNTLTSTSGLLGISPLVIDADDA